jgi:hypothetical protein
LLKKVADWRENKWFHLPPICLPSDLLTSGED